MEKLKFEILNKKYIYNALDNSASLDDGSSIFLERKLSENEIIHPLAKNLIDAQERKLGNLVLQITQSCNLVCDYCPYAQKESIKERTHTNKHMSFEKAKDIIDFYFNNSSDSLGHIIDFYGGEPFIGFETIKKIIKYCETEYKGKYIIYKTTTNGTLLNEEIIDFMIDKDISVTVSLDGIKEVNDANRKYFKSNSSVFDNVIKKLEQIYTKNNEFFSNFVSLNIVVDPQFSLTPYLQLIKEYPFLKELKNILGLNKSDSYLSEKNIISDDYIITYNYALFLCLLELFFGYEFEDETFLFSMLKDSISEIINADSFILPVDFIPGGQCIPGVSKLFANVDGDFMPCERVSEINQRNIIGNVSEGFDYDKSLDMLNFTSFNKANCDNCFAKRHCSLCVASIEHDGYYKEENFSHVCKEMRSLVADCLRLKMILRNYRNGDIYSLLEDVS